MGNLIDYSFNNTNNKSDFMSNPTSYIVMYPESCHDIDLVKGILCLFVGGFKLNANSVRFVLIGDNIDIINEIKNAIYIYKQAKVQEDQNIICCQDVDSLIELNGEILSDDIFYLFMNGRTDISKSAWMNNASFSEFPISEIGEEDKFIIYTSSDNNRSMSLYGATKSILQKNKLNNEIQVIFQVCYNDDENSAIRESLLELAKNLYPTKNLVVTGIRNDDAYRKGMTLLQTITSLLDSAEQSKSGIPKTSSDSSVRAYVVNDLHNVKVRKSIIILEAIEQIRTNPKIDSKIWHENEIMKKTSLLLDMYKEVTSNIPIEDFEFVTDNDIVHKISSKINNSKIDKGMTEEAKRKKAVHTLMKSIEEIRESLPAENNQKSYEAFGIDMNLQKLFNDKALKNMDIITKPWLISDLAFEKELMSNSIAKRIRSYCLDLWELISLFRKNELKGDLSIKDYDLSLQDSINVLALEQTEEGCRLVDEKYIYRITEASENGGFIAFSSSSTGFALISEYLSSININDKVFFGDKSIDLEERSDEFKMFLYSYVHEVNGFSRCFVQYIDNSINVNLKHDSESQGHNLFKMYSFLTNHVGAEILNI